MTKARHRWLYNEATLLLGNVVTVIYMSPALPMQEQNHARHSPRYSLQRSLLHHIEFWEDTAPHPPDLAFCFSMLFSFVLFALAGLFQAVICVSWPPSLQLNPVPSRSTEKPVFQFTVSWDAAAHGGHPPTIEQGQALSKAVFEGLKTVHMSGAKRWKHIRTNRATRSQQKATTSLYAV
ncbi:uncharacterized protein K489DRAFT_425953 [Dissoconium aciculare CBS 342.82]|uniref:Uncharacterized protein n=1 Tax=Dissoconium aciculare CBS 342.82 TaxID=1314786 RepID=A0A6J3M1G3_9PEZI|nr:uncharacterized protein K489DRAFT_425953 [Dissoconium aciculare CBS 342.82]KAF1821339.1 hypothetical protein K489DRAFT_425953 [Dissoconium aciculare CBS 342.82]